MFTKQQKQYIVDKIKYNQRFFDLIIDDIIKYRIYLNRYDYNRLGFDWNKNIVKNYFYNNNRLIQYVQNQIYPLYKETIDEYIENFRRVKLLNQLINYPLNKICKLIKKYNINQQNVLINIYQKYKNEHWTELEPIVNLIEDKKIKTEFEKSKHEQLKLFDDKLNAIAKELLADLNYKK